MQNHNSSPNFFDYMFNGILVSTISVMLVAVSYISARVIMALNFPNAPNLLVKIICIMFTLIAIAILLKPSKKPYSSRKPRTIVDISNTEPIEVVSQSFVEIAGNSPKPVKYRRYSDVRADNGYTAGKIIVSIVKFFVCNMTFFVIAFGISSAIG